MQGDTEIKSRYSLFIMAILNNTSIGSAMIRIRKDSLGPRRKIFTPICKQHFVQ
jgi:hypothetical protein